MRPSNHSVTSLPSRRSGVAVRPEQLRRLRGGAAVGRSWRGRVVELVDDNHVESVGGESLRCALLKRLDHREHMLALAIRAAAREARQKIRPAGRRDRWRATGAGSARGARRKQRRALARPLRRAVGSQAPQPRFCRCQSPRRPGSVAIVAVALDLQQLEHALLMRVGTDVEVGERDRRCSHRASAGRVPRAPARARRR